MPLPAEHAHFLLHLMGIQTWSSRSDVHEHAKRKALESAIQQCQSCRLCHHAKGRALGVGCFSASVVVIVDGFSSADTFTSSVLEHRLFKHILKGLALSPEAVMVTPMIRCVHTNNEPVVDDEAMASCVLHLHHLIHQVKPVCMLVMGEQSARFFQATLNPSHENMPFDWEGIPMFILPSLERLCTHPLEKKQVYQQLYGIAARVAS